jgi:hypothetical protein
MELPPSFQSMSQSNDGNLSCNYLAESTLAELYKQTDAEKHLTTKIGLSGCYTQCLLTSDLQAAKYVLLS